MYQLRFSEKFDAGLDPSANSRHGGRTRARFLRPHPPRRPASPGRDEAIKRDEWSKADPVNRALSTANSCLYGICHAAIVSAGFSPALGFIHTGKMLSFVYDVADLYKTEITVPIAFRAVAESPRAAGTARAPYLPRPVRLHTPSGKNHSRHPDGPDAAKTEGEWRRRSLDTKFDLDCRRPRLPLGQFRKGSVRKARRLLQPLKLTKRFGARRWWS